MIKNDLDLRSGYLKLRDALLERRNEAVECLDRCFRYDSTVSHLLLKNAKKLEGV